MTGEKRQRLLDLLHLTPEEWAEKYNVTRGYVATYKYRNKHLLKELETEMEQLSPEERDEQLERTREQLQDFQEAGLPVDPKDAPRVADIRIWTTTSVDRETGEAVPSVNRYVKMKSPDPEGVDLSMLQATPANITPTRARPAQRDHNILFLFSDTQIDFRRVIDGRTGEQELIPVHDRAAIKVAQMLCKDIQPDYILNLGDTVDYSNLSRFPADSDHFFKTMGLSHQEAHDMYAQFRADNPNATIVEVGSNHIDRFKAWVLKRFPQAYDMYRASSESEYPVMSYPYLANLEHVGVEWVGGGQEAVYTYDPGYTEVINGRRVPIPPWEFAHGTETGQDGKGMVKLVRNHPEANRAQGHAHTEQMNTRINRLGQRVTHLLVPMLAKGSGELPSYHNMVDDHNRVVKIVESMPQGVVVLRDYHGHYVPEFVPIRDGVAYYGGKEYKV